MFRSIFRSKKFLAAIIGVIVAGFAELGLDVPPETVTTIVSPLLAYIVGQGIADHGKERAKIETGPSAA